MRDLKMDNMKGILMILVVTGHVLELFMGKDGFRMLYIFIYLFHMPLFVYCSGYFAKPGDSGKRILSKLFLPYLLFQVFYLVFEKYLLGSNISFQLTTPYWILWYLFALMAWNLCLPLAAVRTVRERKIVLAISVSAALAAGYAEWIGRYLSLSRIIVFFPFFLLGYYMHKSDQTAVETLKKCGKKLFASDLLLLFLLAVSAAYTLYHAGDWKYSWLYEAEAYAESGYSIGFRSLHLSVAFVVILLFRRFLTGRRLPVITGLGAKTMPIYLCHGFVIKWIGSISVFDVIKWKGGAALLLTAGILFIFSWLPRRLKSLFGGSAAPKKE